MPTIDNIIPMLFSTAHNLTTLSTRLLPTTPPDLTTVALLLVIAYLSLMIMSIAARWFLGMVVWVIKMGCILVLALCALWCYQVGVENAIEQIAVWIERGGGVGGLVGRMEEYFGMKE